MSQKLKSHFSKERIRQLAAETNFVKRYRSIKPEELFWSLVQSFSSHQVEQLADLHRAFAQDSGQNVSYSAFYDQLSKPAFFEFMTALYQEQVSQLYIEQYSKIPQVFSRFKDVRLHDGSSWAINSVLKELYPGRFTKVSPAAIEIHATYSLATMSYEKVVIAPDKQSEHDFIPDGEAGVLHIFDRGYVNLAKLEAMGSIGGYYLVRSKENCNPVIRKVVAGSAYQNKCWSQKKFKQRKLKKGKDYDFQVEMKGSEGQVFSLRLVKLWNPKAKKHTGFLTNLSSEQVTCCEIGNLYRLRWQIELSFKELKSYSGLKRFQTANEHIIEGFIVLSILVLHLRRYLVFCAESLKPSCRLSVHKAAISAHNFMPNFVKSMMGGCSNLKAVLVEIFCYLQANTRFSNSKRKNSFDAFDLQKTMLTLGLEA